MKYFDKLKLCSKNCNLKRTMTHKTNLFLVTIFLLLFKPCSGQTDTLIIKGTVLEKTTNLEIVMAKVSIDSFSTTTDINGNFVLKYPCSTDKKFTLTVKYLGYDDYSVTLDKKKSKKALKIYLKPSANPARVPTIYAPQEPMKKEK